MDHFIKPNTRRSVVEYVVIIIIYPPFKYNWADTWCILTCFHSYLIKMEGRRLLRILYKFHEQLNGFISDLNLTSLRGLKGGGVSKCDQKYLTLFFTDVLFVIHALIVYFINISKVEIILTIISLFVSKITNPRVYFVYRTIFKFPVR